MKDSCNAILLYGYCIFAEDTCFETISKMDSDDVIEGTSYTVLKVTNTFDHEYIYIALDYTYHNERDMGEDFDIKNPSEDDIYKFKNFCRKHFDLDGKCAYYMAFSYY